MSLVPRLSNLFKLKLKQTGTPKTWQHKFYHFFNLKDHLVIEIKAGQIVYFNRKALDYFQPKHHKKVLVSTIFGDFPETIKKSSLLKSVKREDLLIVNEIFPISPTNFLLELVENTSSSESATNIKLPLPFPISGEKIFSCFSKMILGFCLSNMDGRIVYANQAFCSMLGYTFEEINQLTINQISPAKWLGYEVEKAIPLFNKTSSVEIFEKEYKSKTGLIIQVEIQLYPFVQDQENLGTWRIVRDIVYQKEVEEALRHNEERFRSIVQKLTDVIFIINTDSIILYDTPPIKKTLGYTEGYLIGKPGLEFIHPDDRELARGRFESIVQEKSLESSLELRMLHADGRWIPVEMVAINMLNHPSVQGILITLRNISERKHIEKQILDAVLKTEEIERDRFAKNLHDDLGPLLSSIKMYINSFSTNSDTKKQNFIIHQLNEVVKEAISTTKDVSNDLSPHILNNYGLVSAIESFLNKIPSTIKVDFKSQLVSDRFSNTIENSTYRIVKELVNNTLKHADAKSISIQLKESGSNIIFNYSDSGKGFIFNKLDKQQINGMGLSNIISRAKSLNASYEFISEKGKGFSFSIKIPIIQTVE